MNNVIIVRIRIHIQTTEDSIYTLPLQPSLHRQTYPSTSTSQIRLYPTVSPRKGLATTMQIIDVSPKSFQAMADRHVGLPMKRSFAHRLKRVVKKFHFKRSLLSYHGYEETAEFELFARTCTHRHGSSQNNLPRSEEQLSETSSSQQLRKPAKVHFADEELQHALASRGSVSLPPAEQIGSLVRRWLDPSDYAEPGSDFKRVCPITYFHVRLICRDGIHDWVSRAATLVKLNDARVPMLEGCTRNDALMLDLQALQVLYCIVESMGKYGVPSWSAADQYLTRGGVGRFRS